VPTVSGTGGRTAIGVLLGVEHDFPVKVTINAGDVGGPSAGLMFALAIYDKLTPGSLTGDHAIAGTGTIDEQEQVGPIGGIRQKLEGARGAGSDYFLAPAANCPEVVGHVPDGLQVVKVATFDEAVSAVEAIARGQASGLPHC
jgi:PDZ domain-containing protein